jgi:rRNA-processing protein FCF1
VGVFEGEAQPLKVLIDTNIIVDVVYQKQIEGYISASTFSDFTTLFVKLKVES